MSEDAFGLPESGSWAARLASGLPDLALSAGCFVTWVAPRSVAPWVPRWILLTMLLEFIVVHSTGFMGAFAYGNTSKREPIVGILGLGAVYSIFAAAFSLGFHTWWPLVSFWVLTLNRLTGVLLHKPSAEDDSAQRMFMASWAMSTLCYLLSVVSSAAMALPRLGFDPGFVASLHLEGGGLWIDEPWRVVACGGLYFGATGVLELFVYPLFAGRRSAKTRAGAGQA